VDITFLEPGDTRSGSLCLLDHLHGKRRVFRIGDFLDASADQFLLRISEEFAKGGIDGQKMSVKRNHEDAHSRVPKGTAKPLFGFEQRFFGQFALSKIDDGNKDPKTIARCDGIQADLDGELLAILVAAVEISPSPHRASFGMGDKAFAKLNMAAPNTLR